MPDDMNEYKLGGWRHDLEDRLRLHARCSSAYLLRRYRGVEIPAVVDPREWLKVEQQGNQGSCQGNALSTVCEFAYKIATGDGNMQFSRHWCYIMSQRMDGIRGDSGSTLGGGQRVCHELGLPLEATVPYPSSYTSTIPNEYAAKLEAAAHKIKISIQCHTYQDVFEFIGNGFGGVQIGVAWDNSYMNTAGVIESFRPGNGGHSVAYVGYTDRKDSSGRNYLLLANSWGKSWGNGGYAEVAPKAVEQQLAHSWTEMIGHTDMGNPKPRRINVQC